MCKECRQYPCHPRCPNAPEPPVARKCDNCGRELLVGESMWEFDIGCVCEECIDSCRTYAEAEEEY